MVVTFKGLRWTPGITFHPDAHKVEILFKETMNNIYSLCITSFPHEQALWDGGMKRNAFHLKKKNQNVIYLL